MKKYVFIFIVFVITSFILLFPKFEFNHLEKKAQDVFTLIEEGIDKNDYKKVKSLTLTHKSILNLQKKTVYFLPKKYAEYLKKKIDLYDKYYLVFQKFEIVKEYEAGIKDVYTKRDDFIKLLNNSKDQKANAMDVYIALNTYISKKDILKNFLNNKFITQEFYNGILADMDKNVEIFNLLNDVADKKVPETQMITKLDEINKKYKTNDLGTLATESTNKIILPQENAWLISYKDLDQEKYLVDSFYEQNNLGRVAIDKKYKTVKLDLKGDGNEETLVITNTIFAYNDKNEMIGRLSEILPLIKPIDGSIKVLNLNKNDKKQVVRIDFPEATNVKSTMIFGMYQLKAGGDTILPVCHTASVKVATDCLFFSKESESLVTADINGDGIVDIDKTIDGKKFVFNGSYFEEVK